MLEAAHGGTLFLDEVGELSPALQVKLLRVLEDRQVLRVGAREPISVDVRFVAATNRDLDKEVAAGRFREDLFYRLNGIALHIPSLRERPADIVPLAERFLVDLGEPLGKPTPRLSQAARERLATYDWPGNVRQLKNVIHSALVMCGGVEIGPDDLTLPARDARASAPTIDQPMEASLDELPDQLRQRASEAERKKIVEALEACSGNQTRAAKLLGITRRVLVRRLQNYNIPRPRDSRDD